MTNRVLLIALSVAVTSFAASWDIVGTAGVGLTKSTSVTTSRVRFGSGGLAGGINVGFKLMDLGVGKLELEAPFVASSADRFEVSRGGVDLSGLSLFFTPGARFRIGNDRASAFGSFGAGAARDEGLSIASVFSLPGTSHFALGYAGGADVRLVGPLKLRGEIRNFAVKGPIGWSNRPFFLGGLGLQF